MTPPKTAKRRGVRVKCPLGGYAPCVDDLCYGGGRTLCGLYLDEEVCFHRFIPETCPEGCADDDYPDFDVEDDEEQGR
jgi:hypothetical protein